MSVLLPFRVSIFSYFCAIKSGCISLASLISAVYPCGKPIASLGKQSTKWLLFHICVSLRVKSTHVGSQATEMGRAMSKNVLEIQLEFSPSMASRREWDTGLSRHWNMATNKINQGNFRTIVLPGDITTITTIKSYHWNSLVTSTIRFMVGQFGEYHMIWPAGQSYDFFQDHNTCVVIDMQF